MEALSAEKMDGKFEDLPIESIKRICACMTVPNMVRACLTLPGWSYVLNLPYIKKLLTDYISEFRWFDNDLCESLSDENSSDIFSDAPRAILHVLSEESSASSGLPSNDNSPLPVFWNPPIPVIEAYTRHCIFTYSQSSSTYTAFFFLIHSTYFTCLDQIVVVPTFEPVLPTVPIRPIVHQRESQVLLVLLISDPRQNKLAKLQNLKQFYLENRDYLRQVERWRIWNVEIRGDEFVNLSAAVTWACNAALEIRH